MKSFILILISKLLGKKREWKKLTGLATLEKLRKLLVSMREFFIPSMFHSFLGHVLLWFLKFIMTGTYIAIGVDFMHGGAYNIALLMNYTLKGKIVWRKGDIKKFDKNIQSIIVRMYPGIGYMCYRKDNKTADALRYLRSLFRHFMYHIDTKIVLHLGNFFRIERGKVYSGGLETSLLDSVAKLFLFCLFVVYTAWKYPHVAPYIKQCVMLRLICMIVYGDDHIWGVPELLDAIFNIRTYAFFLMEFFNIELREGEEFKDFLTTINPVTQEIIKPGLVFLKRYFIKSTEPDFPPVIAFKPTRDILTSFAAKEYCETTGIDIDPIEALLSAIGQAYDAQWNHVAYNAIKEAFDMIISRYSIPDPETELRNFMDYPDKRVKVNKIMRRTGILEKHILCSFPTWEQIRERMILNVDKCQFGQKKRVEHMDYSLFQEMYF